jgi:hypothetical protein
LFESFIAKFKDINDTYAVQYITMRILKESSKNLTNHMKLYSNRQPSRFLLLLECEVGGYVYY